MRIYVDADACPVKDEIYRVANRYQLEVTVVSNSSFYVPADSLVRMVIVKEGIDAADDWIVEQLSENDVVITADIPLASRSLQKGAHVLGFTGNPFTPDNIGDAVATRELLAGLCERGEVRGGPPPFDKRDRSRFLQGLDRMIQAIRQDSANDI